MLVLTRKKNESIIIGDNIEIVITDITEDKVKIGIVAPKSVNVYRKELVEAVKNENMNSTISRQVDMNVIKNLIIKEKNNKSE